MRMSRRYKVPAVALLAAGAICVASSPAFAASTADAARSQSARAAAPAEQPHGQYLNCLQVTINEEHTTASGIVCNAALPMEKGKPVFIHPVTIPDAAVGMQCDNLKDIYLPGAKGHIASLVYATGCTMVRSMPQQADHPVG